MAVDESNSLVSCSMDDTLRFTSLDSKEYSAQDTLKLNEQPKSVAVGPGGCTVVICIGQILLLKDRKKAFVIEAPGFGPEAVSIHPSNGIVAVGGVDGKVHMYDIDGNTLKKHATVSALQAHGPVTDVAFSPNGAFLAVCDSNKVVSVFNTVDDYKEHGTFYGHHAKVTCLAWSPDCQHFATGGMDMMVYVWTVEDPNNRIRIPDSHRMHHVSGIAWLDTHTLVTTSHDATVRQWTITY